MASKTDTAAKASENTAAETTSTAAKAAPVITTVSTDIAMPERANNRGSRTSYPFDQLTVVGASFGVVGKTKKQMASIITNQNKSKANTEVKKDESGAVVYKTNKVTDANGNVNHIPTNDPELVSVRHFVAFDVDPKTDPAGATVRIFRDK